MTPKAGWQEVPIGLPTWCLNERFQFASKFCLFARCACFVGTFSSWHYEKFQLELCGFFFFSTSLSEHPEKARGEVMQSTALQLEATLGLPLWAPGGEVSAKNNTQVLLACLLWGGVLQQKVNFFWQKSGGFTDEILSSIFGVGVSEI